LVLACASSAGGGKVGRWGLPEGASPHRRLVLACVSSAGGGKLGGGLPGGATLSSLARVSSAGRSEIGRWGFLEGAVSLSSFDAHLRVISRRGRHWEVGLTRGCAVVVVIRCSPARRQQAGAKLGGGTYWRVRRPRHRPVLACELSAGGGKVWRWGLPEGASPRCCLVLACVSSSAGGGKIGRWGLLEGAASSSSFSAPSSQGRCLWCDAVVGHGILELGP
jgi:hypothetical protein